MAEVGTPATSQVTPPQEHVIEIPLRQGGPHHALIEVWKHRELLWFLLIRDLKARYRQTLFGPAWVVMMPIINSGLFALVFGVLAGLPSGGVPYPIFVFSGLLIWSLMARTLAATGNCLIANQHLLTKVYFPRLVIPFAAALGCVVDFLIGSLLLLAVLIIPGYLHLDVRLLAAPVFALMATTTGLAVGLWLAALGVRLRDVKHAGVLIPQIWMWITPVAYSSELVLKNRRVPAELQGTLETVFQLNPMYLAVEGFRWSLLDHARGRPTTIALVGGLMSMLLLLGGMSYFRRCERVFADVV